MQLSQMERTIHVLSAMAFSDARAADRCLQTATGVPKEGEFNGEPAHAASLFYKNTDDSKRTFETRVRLRACAACPAAGAASLGRTVEDNALQMSKLCCGRRLSQGNARRKDLFLQLWGSSCNRCSELAAP